MPEILTPTIVQLGSTAVVSLFALWAMVEVVKSKRNKQNGNGEVKKLIQNLEGNHLQSIETKIERLDTKMDEKLDKIITLLEIIKERIKR